tara:strand:+ start:410 stop:526 length:117 start_codon:yes stop_codon:yes gene_type:complete
MSRLAADRLGYALRFGTSALSALALALHFRTSALTALL